MSYPGHQLFEDPLNATSIHALRAGSVLHRPPLNAICPTLASVRCELFQTRNSLCIDYASYKLFLPQDSPCASHAKRSLILFLSLTPPPIFSVLLVCARQSNIRSMLKSVKAYQTRASNYGTSFIVSVPLSSDTAHQLVNRVWIFKVNFCHSNGSRTRQKSVLLYFPRGFFFFFFCGRLEDVKIQCIT